MTEAAIENGEYPEDWEEQGWCCRECAAIACRYPSPAVLRRSGLSMPVSA